MFGNRLGWIISAAMIAFTAILLLLASRADTISPPGAYTRNPAVLAPLPPLPGMNAVLAMDEPGDAAAAYAKAIAAYHRNESAFERFAEGNLSTPAIVAPLQEGLDALKSATRLSRCTLFTASPATIVNYDSVNSDLTALDAVATAAARLGLFTRDADPKGAMALFEAAFGCGAKLFNERVTYNECFVGLGLMGQSTKYIALLSEKAGDAARAEATRTFEVARAAYATDNLLPTANVLRTIDPRKMGLYVGDVFAFASGSQERMWRVEAIKELGLIRFAAMTDKRKGDQLGALRASRKYALDPDPVIAAAGKTASELTPEGFNQIR